MSAIPVGVVPADPAGGGEATLTYKGSADSRTGDFPASKTFSDFDIGAADTNRRVIVCISTNSGTAADVASVTIGGNSANKDVGNGTQRNCSIWSLVVPTGTTATIVINAPGGGFIENCTIYVYTITGAASTLSTTSSGAETYVNTAPVGPASFANPKFLLLLVGGIDASGNLTPSGVTEDAETTLAGDPGDSAVGSSTTVGTATRTFAGNDANLGYAAATYT